MNFGDNVVAFDEDKVATEALVFMLVGIQGHWKCPVGYVLCNSITSSNLNTLIKNCLQLSFQHNLNVHSVTCDGTKGNFDSLKKFGCKFGDKPEEIDGYFQFNGNKLVFVPDVCHMLKLARNFFAAIGEFLDPDGNKINWKYINLLHKIQEKEGLKFANKLSKGHVEFQRHKMNVKIAAQTLSSSVADAVQFLMNTGHPEFSDAAATIKFIRIVDRLFDVLNSRSAFNKGYKKPLFLYDKERWFKILQESIDYLGKLTTITGQLITTHRRKTFLVGLITASSSIKALAMKLLTKHTPLKFVLTYKFSQDHLELLFSCIRGKNGYNDNPDVRQLKSSLKRILLRNTICGSRRANCMFLNPNLVAQYFH